MIFIPANPTNAKPTTLPRERTGTSKNYPDLSPDLPGWIRMGHGNKFHRRCEVPRKWRAKAALSVSTLPGLCPQSHRRPVLWIILPTPSRRARSHWFQRIFCSINSNRQRLQPERTSLCPRLTCRQLQRPAWVRPCPCRRVITIPRCQWKCC